MLHRHRWRSSPCCCREGIDDLRAVPMVKAEAVHKSFGRLEVLRGIDLEVSQKEVLCMIGPSGSGKSTFLRCINHLEKIDAGRLSVDGELVGYQQCGDKLYELRESEVCQKRSEIGMVFQRFNLFPHKTALENVTEAPILVKRESRSAAVDRGRKLLDRMGFAREVGDSLVFMDGGVVVEAGKPRDVLTNPQHERTRSFLSKVL